MSLLDDLLNDLLTMNAKLKAMPEPLAYIVLDHAVTNGKTIEERDGRGRKYVRVPPSILDAVKHIKEQPARLGTSILPASLTGIPLYRREDMPEGWPYLDPSA